ncbi:MAG: ASKHA domain-containing protein, partial [Desulfobacteraceae bacterium]
FDIGTTTLVGKLIDLENGREKGVISRLNSQIHYGANVIRRIQYIRESKKGFKRLRRLLIRDLNAIARRLAEAGGIETKNIFVAVAAGNTTMQHILLGLDPSGIAEAPFVPVVTEGVTFPTRLLNLDLNPDAMLYVLPSKSGYIGGDLMGFILSSGVAELEGKIVLGLDLGTNGEIFLGNRSRVLTCSAAAGPALEGARITHGMIAKSGAIESVYVDNQQLKYRVIGNINPRGICGSGLVDLVAVLLHFGVIDPEGLIGPKQIDEAGKLFASRLVRSEFSDIQHFLVASPEASFDGRTIVLYQKDVRELQLAKGAVAAGIEILMQQLGITAGDIDQIYLAGALGNYVHPLSAMRIGLMPRVDPRKVVTLGNAAAAGAAMALLSKKKWQQLRTIADQVEHVELSLHPGFDDLFVAAMDFPDSNMW